MCKRFLGIEPSSAPSPREMASGRSGGGVSTGSGVRAGSGVCTHLSSVSVSSHARRRTTPKTGSHASSARAAGVLSPRLSQHPAGLPAHQSDAPSRAATSTSHPTNHPTHPSSGARAVRRTTPRGAPTPCADAADPVPRDGAAASAVAADASFASGVPFGSAATAASLAATSLASLAATSLASFAASVASAGAAARTSLTVAPSSSA
eukprot:6032508-Prymnesium_polylepis.2